MPSCRAVCPSLRRGAWITPATAHPEGSGMTKVLLAGPELVWVCGQQGPEPLDAVLCWGVGLRPGFSKRLKDSVVVPGQEAADAVHWGASSECLVSWS